MPPIAFMTRRTSLAVAAMVVSTLGVTIARANANVVITAPANLILDNYGTGNGLGYQNDTSFTTPEGAAISFTGPSGNNGDAGVYSGSVNAVAITPFNTSSKQDYLVAQPSGGVTITYTTAQTSFALLWGTVDTFNSLVFSTDSGTIITGTQIENADPSLTLGVSNVEVLLSNIPSFKSITVESTSSAFEFDTARAVPEPASMALLGVGMIGTGVMVRRRRSALTVTAG